MSPYDFYFFKKEKTMRVFIYFILGILALTLAVGGIRQSNLNEVQFEEEPAQKSKIVLDDEVIEQIKNGMKSKSLYLNPTLSLAKDDALLLPKVQ